MYARFSPAEGRSTMKRIHAGACLVVLAMIVVGLGAAGCGGDDSGALGSSTVSTAAGSTATTAPVGEEKTFTVGELAEFDGQEGRAAYVAVDGVVYDVSDSARWPEGRHSSCNLGAMAGNDLSAEIEQAPANMRALLEKMPVVGKLE
jgi:predicted heme/steroid binding protein